MNCFFAKSNLPLSYGQKCLAVLCSLMMLGLSACGGGDGGDGGGAAGPASRPGRAARPCGTQSGTGCANVSSRVDLFEPAFSVKSAKITNPLNPVSELKSGLFLGQVDGLPFRTETTVLPNTRVVQVKGQPVELLVYQYMAFSEGHIQEVAIDYFAQDDDGNVWYFGEDVADYDEDGKVATTEGTWFFAKDNAPMAMIMAANPKAGNVWLAEDTAPAAWEEITVKAVGVAAAGPKGPLGGGLLGSELHMDGTRQDKIFMPGYGEFQTGSLATNDLEALALTVPIDALQAPVPDQLKTMSGASAAIFSAAASNDFAGAATSLSSLSSAWDSYQTGQVPPLLKAEMARVLALLKTAVQAQIASDTRDEAIALTRVIYDLRLRYQPITEIDQVRLDLWMAQVAVDAEASDFGPIRGDAVTAALVFERFKHVLEASAATNIAAKLDQLKAAAQTNDAVNAAFVANQIRGSLASGWK
jgi:hypothetical protein